MADLRPVRYLDPDTWRVGAGWLNRDAVALARPVNIDLHKGLCEACAEKAARRGLVHTALAVRLLDGSMHVVLGDGRSGDAEAVSVAKRLLKGRRRCVRAEHDGAPPDWHLGLV